MLRKNGFHGRIPGQIVPFVGIACSLVEFFRAVPIADEAMAARDDGDIARTKAGAGHVRPFSIGSLQERTERTALVPGIGVQPRQVEQSGVEIDQLNGLVAADALRNSRAGDDQGDAGTIPPHRPFGPVFLFTEMKTVIAEKNDDGVLS